MFCIFDFNILKRNSDLFFSVLWFFFVLMILSTCLCYCGFA
ncbi:hypothetical protein FCR2A7T_28780 [Flavobacterium cauense R2A-7]|nr:hypothetical protein FCR2A7T_28780 [Flavobacterium cauense R2A-7]